MVTFADVRWFFMPYCLDRQPDGSWLTLNRNYKPLGALTDKHVDYKTHASRVQLKGLTKAVARKLSSDEMGKDIPDRIYLYDDGRVPTRTKANMATYLEKLAILAKLKIQVD